MKCNGRFSGLGRFCAWTTFVLAIGTGCDVDVDGDFFPIGVVPGLPGGGGETGEDPSRPSGDDILMVTGQGEPVTITMSYADTPWDTDLTFGFVQQPDNGELIALDNAGLATAVVTYKPADGFVGLDSFEFVADDDGSIAEDGSLSPTASGTRKKPRRAWVSVLPRVFFGVQPNRGQAPLKVVGTATTLGTRPLPPGTYTWTFRSRSESITDRITVSQEMHSLRSHGVFLTTPGTYIVTLSLTLANLGTPIPGVHKETNTKEDIVTVLPGHSVDADNDGKPDSEDGCPDDSNKTAPGICGCGVADTDSDGDGVPDCNDQCPGAPDKDADGDGVPDCIDGCPDDPNKTASGDCGCGVSDRDADNDGKADCNGG